MKQRFLPLFSVARPVKYKDDSGEYFDGFGLGNPFPISSEEDFSDFLFKAEKLGFSLFIVGFFDPLLRPGNNSLFVTVEPKKIESFEAFKAFYLADPFIDILFKEKEVSEDASKPTDEKSE